MTDTKQTLDTSLFAITPIDGRYQKQVAELQKIFSEFGLIKYRVEVETKWFELLLHTLEIGDNLFKENQHEYLRKIRENYDEDDATKIKLEEKITNHDVKAIEYFLRKKLENSLDPKLLELLHFACTSDDINNLSYALMLKESRTKVLLPNLDKLIETLHSLAKEYADIPMLARTHGQPATPTTVGKEFTNFMVRLKKQRDNLAKIEIMGKFNGATGNFSAHSIAFPNINWQTVCQKFVEDFGLTFNSHTTQIEPHDYIVEISNILAHINNILLGFCRDMWGYISLNYFTPKHDEYIGSSVMPHKINPIDFENAEGNLGLANALLQHFANKLPISRWQRDLSDSTVMRNIGLSFAYCLIAYKSLGKGLGKIAVNKEFLQSELDQHWEVLAEAIQTTMRGHMIPNSYEQLRELTRGKKVDRKTITDFIDKLAISNDAKERLKSLTPNTYIGLASKLVESI